MSLAIWTTVAHSAQVLTKVVHRLANLPRHSSNVLYLDRNNLATNVFLGAVIMEYRASSRNIDCVQPRLGNSGSRVAIIEGFNQAN